MASLNPGGLLESLFRAFHPFLPFAEANDASSFHWEGAFVGEDPSPVAAHTLHMTLSAGHHCPKLPTLCFSLFFISSFALVIALGGGFTPFMGLHHTSLSINYLDPGDTSQQES